MILLGILIIIGMVLWRINLRLEWNIPQKWQNAIQSWQEGISAKTHNLKYIWNTGRVNGDLERNFYHLEKSLPRLQKKLNASIWIEVLIYRGGPCEQNETYIACLQRRFPGLAIHQYSPNDSDYPFKGEQT